MNNNLYKKLQLLNMHEQNLEFDAQLKVLNGF